MMVVDGTTETFASLCSNGSQPNSPESEDFMALIRTGQNYPVLNCHGCEKLEHCTVTKMCIRDRDSGSLISGEKHD